MKIKVFITILVVASFIVNDTTAQNSTDWCFTDQYHKQLMQTNIEYRKSREELESATRAFIQNQNTNGYQKASGVPIYTIPVVFHIIHNYGNENISKSRVLDEIEFLNKSFQNLWADTVDVNPPFKPIITDAQIQFKLAQIDPNGNCTDGITRTVSNYTYGQDNLVKALIKWPSNKYMNVWTVASIGGGGGTLAYATYPSNNNPNDGIVTMSAYVGSPLAGYNQRVLTHEVGHWLNLSHTWGGGAVGAAINCSDDDLVQDTPNTIGTFGCSYSQITCNTLDNVENYMDYASCSLMFTEGQKTRMHAALNNSVGARNNLHTIQNLQATGTDPGFIPPPCLPIVDFNKDQHYICTGESIDFTDLSWRGDPTSWQWDFPGGTPSVSFDQNPVVTYNTPGVYDVTLTAGNGAGSNSVTQTALVVVSPSVGSNNVPYLEDFENTTFPDSYKWIVENNDGNGWELTSSAGFSGTKSVRLFNHSGNPAETYDAFVTPGFDFTNIINANMTFQVAFAARSTQSTDQLKVYASSNCGETWALRVTKSGLNLSTAGIMSGSFTPGSASLWRLENVNVSGISFNNKPSVRFKFEYLQDSGNNIYIDDINVTGTSTVGIKDVEFLATLNVYPNPSNSITEISFNLSESSNVRIDIVDVTGRIIQTLEDNSLSAGNHVYNFGETLKAGAYFVKVKVNDNDITKKVILTR